MAGLSYQRMPRPPRPSPLQFVPVPLSLDRVRRGGRESLTPGTANAKPKRAADSPQTTAPDSPAPEEEAMPSRLQRFDTRATRRNIHTPVSTS